ncbi:MAG: conserved membrane protein of unknown function, partial [Nitrosopumilales archaeon]
MAIKAALIITGISIALLVIYALDIAVNEIAEEGFLGLDNMTRGIGLGMPAIILPIIAFFISRKKKSSGLGIMLIISGILIIIGGIALFVLEPSPEALESGRSIMERAAP